MNNGLPCRRHDGRYGCDGHGFGLVLLVRLLNVHLNVIIMLSSILFRITTDFLFNLLIVFWNINNLWLRIILDIFFYILLAQDFFYFRILAIGDRLDHCLNRGLLVLWIQSILLGNMLSRRVVDLEHPCRRLDALALVDHR